MMMDKHTLSSEKDRERERKKEKNREKERSNNSSSNKTYSLYIDVFWEKKGKRKNRRAS
jgi:hypothetical protein